ncbi:MAG: radical SAM protein, partial [Thermodesulfobacteriota bacterium]|nr:radical SAM protein [Thermodesulfobacteriota bacterium]
DSGGGAPEVAGMWFKHKETHVRPPLRPLMLDFSQHTTVDNNFHRHYLTHKGKIVRIENGIAKRFLVSNYMTMTSFGCSMRCAYCINNKMKRLYPDWDRVRRRPVDHIIVELKDAVNKIPRIWSVDLVDDDFCSAHVEYLEEFRDKYKGEIGLPLDVMGLRPADVVPEKMDILRDMGAVKVRMGIQAVNREAKKLFKRTYSNKFLMKKVNLLHRYRKDFFGIRYDFIVDTPWDDKTASIDILKFMSRMPPPFFANIFTLAFYPGSELYDRALKERIIEPNDVWEGRLNKNFMELKPTWVNFLLTVMSIVHISPPVLNMLLRPTFLCRVRPIPTSILKLAQALVSAKRFLVFLAHGDRAQLRKVFLYLTEYGFLFRPMKKG